MDSILTSIKKLLGIAEDYTHFDADIIIHINTVFLTLSQLGVGPSEGFSITNEYSTWDEYLPDGQYNLEAVKTYIFLKVKLLFDPPMSSIVTESMNRMTQELEWRINTEIELSKSDGEEE